ncbi:MAG: sensor histidine kinase [Rhodoferax sp.]
MMRSFRWRIALGSGVLAGLVLAAFALASLWLVRGIKTEKLDLELRSHAERLAARLPDSPDWAAYTQEIERSTGVRDRADLALLVLDAQGQPLYQSSPWPSGLALQTLPWPSPLPGAQRAWHDALPLLGMGQAQAATLDSPAALGAAPWLPRGLRANPWGGDARWPRAVQARGGGAGGGGGRGGMGPGGAGLPPAGPGAGEPLAPPLAAPGAPAPPAPPPAAPPPPPPAPSQPPAPGPDPEPGLREPAPAPAAPPLRAPAAEVLPEPPLPAPRVPPAPPAPAAAAATPAAPAAAAPQAPPLAPVVPAPTVAPPVSGNARLADADADAHWHLGLAVAPHGRVLLAVHTRSLDAELRPLRNALLGTAPFALVLIGLGSWVFSARALKPLTRLTHLVQHLHADALDQRLGAQGEDREFAALIEVFNRMLERLQRSFSQAHRFSADAAHELKTPLAIMQGQVERALALADDGSPLQAQLSSVLEEIQRLSTISRKLLLLSQADAGRLRLLTERVDLSEALESLVEDARMLAPALDIRADITPELTVQADAVLLRQVLHNLLSNAIKYNTPPEGTRGWIHIGALRWAKQVEVVVSNTSSGIAPEQRAHIFDRFYRADSAHSRQVEGVGLGLSVAREIARAHGGELSLAGDSEGAVRFSLLLPLDGGPKTPALPMA